MDWSLTPTELRRIVSEVKSGKILVGWWRVVPVCGLEVGNIFVGRERHESFEELKYDHDEFIAFDPDGVLFCGDEILEKARRDKVENIEVYIGFSVNWLKDKGQPLKGGGVEWSRRILPKLSPEQERNMKRFLGSLKGREAEYPVLTISRKIDVSKIPLALPVMKNLKGTKKVS